MTTGHPYKSELPSGWEDKIQGFKKLILIKIFAEEKILAALAEFVDSRLGRKFVEPSPWTLDDVFTDTTCRIPIVFVLSTGLHSISESL